jgi:hypothetical protein
MSFQDDLNWFESNRAFIAQSYQGQWVLIKDKAIKGAYPSSQAAIAAGLSMFGKDFLVKQALAQEPVHTIPAAKL